MGAFKLLEFTLLLNLLSSTNHPLSGLLWSAKDNGPRLELFPPSCNRIECPSYELVEEGNGFEIRRYNSSVWMSTSPILDISFTHSTRTGFLQLFDYIQGKNEYKKKIEMTAPVLVQVSPSDGPFCESSFVVSFYVPKENQADTPPAKGLHVQRWQSTYVAVRQFGGFVTDAQIGEEAAILQANLSGSKWADAIKKSEAEESYTVAQYNSPFEFKNRVNEIWFRFSVQDGGEI